MHLTTTTTTLSERLYLVYEQIDKKILSKRQNFEEDNLWGLGTNEKEINTLRKINLFGLNIK